MKFINEEVEKRFECTADADIVINTSSYHGPISNINIKTAEFLVKSKDANIKERKKVPAPAAPPK
jgi:hypothetical protein